MADGLHLSEDRRVGLVLSLDHSGRLQPIYYPLGTLSLDERRGCEENSGKGIGKGIAAQRANAKAPVGQRALLHQWRTEGVHKGKGDGAYPGKTEPSTDAGQDRALPPFDEEHHQTGQLLYAGGTQGKVGRVRGLLQQQEIPRIIGQPDTGSRIFRKGQKDIGKT